MKCILVPSFVLMIAVLCVWGQLDAAETKSPKEVVEEFWKLETQGTRLTLEGWRNAGRFFLHPSPPPPKKTLALISRRYPCSATERWVKDNHAEIANGCFDLGRIDEALRYIPPDSRYDKMAVLYRLVLTDKYWELGPDGVTEKQVTGPMAWRIENSEPIFWLTVDTAIRYVTNTRDKTTDPIIKENAGRTLVKLKKLQ